VLLGRVEGEYFSEIFKYVSPQTRFYDHPFMDITFNWICKSCHVRSLNVTI
jgi:hypothetical protein